MLRQFKPLRLNNSEDDIFNWLYRDDFTSVLVRECAAALLLLLNTGAKILELGY
jgi:hypothetical protein